MGAMTQKFYFMILTALLIVSLGCSPESRTAEERVKIGAVLPLTGIAAIHGQNERQGIDLAVKEINAAGGIDGKHIEVIYEDDESTPTKSLTAVKKLIDVDGVHVVIGGTWDILANAIIPEIDKQKVVLLSPSALPDTLTQTSPYFFSVHSPVAINQKVFEAFLTNLPGKRVGAIVVNNPWGFAHLNTFKKAVDATGAELVEERVVQNFDNNDLSTELAIVKEQQLDGLFVTLNFNDMVILGRKRMELDIRTPLLAHSNLVSSIEAGRLPITTGAGITIFRFSAPSPQFVDTFTAEYGKPPEIYSDIAYDTVYVIKQSIEKHGDSVEGILQGIREVNLTGASGNIYFGHDNYPANKQPILEKITNGAYVKVD